MPEFETILYEVDDHVATITLNRPERLNAFNGQMLRDVMDAIDLVDADDDVRAVIFTGEGRGYCAGADLSGGSSTFDIESQTDEQKAVRASERSSGGDMEWMRDGGGLLTLRLYECNKPLIAAINGPAVGVGVTMTLPMDIRLASTKARIGFVFARRGLVPEACSSYFLPRVVGLSKALEWCFSGRVFDANEALEGGLVRSLHEPDDLLPAARAIAAEIAENTSAVSVSVIRHMLWRMQAADHPMEAHKIDSRGIYHLGRGADAHEGVTSFLEKRPPEFTLRPTQDLPDYFPWWDEPEFS
ncbi:crotonase/enoyl-CoA hydratase family protein [Candidatus Poriferisodalis sp.]|uniref:crotonase/enoyl-CoA hydratase family protein n=1 Tax=Candidatus Poriferisodalis sp. TaxID=3101277 RepID=UPI003B5298FC